MKILTIGASPYLFNREGKVHHDILKELKTQGNDVISLCWNLSLLWTPKDKDENFVYQIDKNPMSQLIPFQGEDPVSLSTQTYDVLKLFNPDIILSIGNFEQTEFIYSLKLLCENNFKWINILTNDSPIKEKHKEVAKTYDYCICTNNQSFQKVKQFNKNSCLKYYFPNLIDTFSLEKSQGKILNILTFNNQNSNIDCILRACANLKDIHLTIISNNYPLLDELLDFYNVNTTVLKFDNQNNDGLSNEELILLYKNNHIVLDTSIKSTSALALLEGLSFGCLPIYTNNIPIFKDLFNENSVYSVQYNDIFIAHSDSLKEKLLQTKEIFSKDNLSFFAQINDLQEKIKIIKEKDLVKGLSNFIENISLVEDKIQLESL